MAKIEKKKPIDGLGWFVSAEPPEITLHTYLFESLTKRWIDMSLKPQIRTVIMVIRFPLASIPFILQYLCTITAPKGKKMRTTFLPSSMSSADLVTFTEEILNGKLLCSDT